MDQSKVEKLTELANSTGPDGSYDLNDKALDNLAATPEGKEAVKQAKAQRKS